MDAASVLLNKIERVSRAGEWRSLFKDVPRFLLIKTAPWFP